MLSSIYIPLKIYNAIIDTKHLEKTATSKQKLYFIISQVRQFVEDLLCF